MLEVRKQQEVEFHDKLREGHYAQRWTPEAERSVADHRLWSNFKYYAIEHGSLALMERWVRERVNGASVLDYCCGNGHEAFSAQRNGAASVVGIDLSPVSIANCQERAQREGLASSLEFKVMDAEALGFPSNSFDLIVEYGVLHHLDLERAMAELARVTKPTGAIICTETLGHNPVIGWYRRRTPHLRTAWEVDHIITKRSFDIIRRHFGCIEMRFFHLATLAAVPFRNTPVFGPVLRMLEAADRAILSLPVVRWQAWQVVFRLSKPIKDVE